MLYVDMCKYKSIKKTNTLLELGKNSSKFPTNDHLMVSTDNLKNL